MPSQQKYQYVLESTRGEKKLKRIFKYDKIIFCEDINTSTQGYILFENNDSQYKITF
ncbi:18896_t:CDS:1, partial [Gigaspora margarita]